MNREAVIAAVQTKLDERTHNGFSLHVFSEGVREDASWWYVPVVVRGHNAPPTDFLYSTYASIEADLAEEADVNVLLVPVIAEQDSA